MARSRTPTNILELKGSFKKDPKRLVERGEEPLNANPIGDAPDWLSEDEVIAWNEIVHDAIDGVLGEADRLAVANASVLCSNIKIKEASAQEQNLFNKYLGQFGMIPSERSKINMPKKKDKNRFDED